jgi:hypothetical protein
MTWFSPTKTLVRRALLPHLIIRYSFVYFFISYFGLFYLFLHSDIIQFTNCSLRRVGAIELSVDSNVLKLLDVCPRSTFFCGTKISICHGTIYALRACNSSSLTMCQTMWVCSMTRYCVEYRLLVCHAQFERFCVVERFIWRSFSFMISLFVFSLFVGFLNYLQIILFLIIHDVWQIMWFFEMMNGWSLMFDSYFQVYIFALAAIIIKSVIMSSSLFFMHH